NEARSLGEGVPGLKLRISQASFAGPGGPPINIIVAGNDDAQLARIAGQVEQIVRRTPGTTDVTNSTAIGSTARSVSPHPGTAAGRPDRSLRRCAPVSREQGRRSTSRRARRTSTSA